LEEALRASAEGVNQALSLDETLIHDPGKPGSIKVEARGHGIAIGWDFTS
jgi:hypothetical protein